MKTDTENDAWCNHCRINKKLQFWYGTDKIGNKGRLQTKLLLFSSQWNRENQWWRMNQLLKLNSAAFWLANWHWNFYTTHAKSCTVFCKVQNDIQWSSPQTTLHSAYSANPLTKRTSGKLTSAANTVIKPKMHLPRMQNHLHTCKWHWTNTMT